MNYCVNVLILLTLTFTFKIMILCTKHTDSALVDDVIDMIYGCSFQSTLKCIMCTIVNILYTCVCHGLNIMNMLINVIVFTCLFFFCLFTMFPCSSSCQCYHTEGFSIINNEVIGQCK